VREWDLQTGRVGIGGQGRVLAGDAVRGLRDTWMMQTTRLREKVRDARELLKASIGFLPASLKEVTERALNFGLSHL
jgi:hypothetical protein